MSDNEYKIEYAATGRSKCTDSKCKEQIESGAIRIGKICKNPFSPGDTSAWLLNWRL